MSTELTRRAALRLIGGTTAVGLLAVIGDQRGAPAGDQAASDSASFVTIGTVESAAADRLAIATEEGLITAVRQAHTRAYAGVTGRVSDFTGFAIGDRVFVTGSRAADGTVAAHSIGSVFRPVQAVITAVDEHGRASTNIGDVDLRGSLPDHGSAAAGLGAGSVIDGYTWSHPQSGDTFLVAPPR